MAFRNHFFRPSPPASHAVVETSLKQATIGGVDVFTPVDVDASTKPSLPSAEDYRLSALLQSGAPLNFVSPQIYNNPDLDVANFVESNLVDEYVSPETDNQTDTNND